MCSLLFFVHADFQLSAIIETLSQMIPKIKSVFGSCLVLVRKVRILYELYVGSVRVQSINQSINHFISGFVKLHTKISPNFYTPVKKKLKEDLGLGLVL